MKKAIILAISIFVATTQAYATDIFYQNTSDSSKLYQKDLGNTANGSAITSNPVSQPCVSPDNTTLVFTDQTDFKLHIRSTTGGVGNGTVLISGAVFGNLCSFSQDGANIYYANGGNIWKKSASDSAVGSIVATGGNASKESRDGLWLFYQNNSDGGRLYKKSSSDSSVGSPVTSVPVDFGFDLSPDGNDLIYTSSSHSYQIYKKSANDSLDGSAITSQQATSPQYSPDGTEIAYIGPSPTYIWKKSASDTLNGAAINSNGAATIAIGVPYISPANCHDGIQNQDETGIDYGGVCGGKEIPYTGTGASEGTTCTTSTYVDNSDANTTWNTSYGTLTPRAWTPSSSPALEPGYKLGWDDISTDGIQKDAFRGIHFETGSSLPHEVMNWTNTGAGTVVNYLPGAITPISANRPIVFVGSSRSGSLVPFNVIQFRSIPGFDNDRNTPVSQTYFGFNDANGNQTYLNDKLYLATRDTSTGSTFTARMQRGLTAQYAQITPNDGLQAMRFGYSSGTTNKTECKNAEYSCTWRKIDTSYACQGNYTPAADNPDIYATGQCGITAEGYCAPVKSLRDATASEVKVLDGSGTYIGRKPDPAGTTKAVVDAAIFSCSYTGLETLACPFQVATKIWAMFSGLIKTIGDLIVSIGNLGSSPGTGKIMSFIGIPTTYADDLGKSLPAYWLQDGSGNVLPDVAPSYTGADMMGLNHGMYTAGDHAKNLPRGGIKGVWTFSWWALMLIGLLFALALIAKSFNNNQP